MFLITWHETNPVTMDHESFVYSPRWAHLSSLPFLENEDQFPKESTPTLIFISIIGRKSFLLNYILIEFCILYLI